MPKGKTHKGLRKRIKVTANGKVKHKRSRGSHLMSHMSGKQVRNLRNDLVCARSVAKKLQQALQIRLIGRDQG
ncbi:MAG: 50S ribosomal protein L35 [Phycisphaerae bacterium]|nr:50S ribosomal protein L35 [Phycisphaerae bacterium]